jgi:hypothetical protein
MSRFAAFRTTMIRERSAVRISTSIARKIGRPGVVVRLFVIDGRRLALVAWGTGTLRTHLRHVAVVPREPAGIVLGLTKPTYFYGMNVWVGLPDRLEELGTLCPRYLLAALRALVGPMK